MGYEYGKHIYSAEDLSNWTETDFALSERDMAEDFLAQHKKERVWHAFKERNLMTSAKGRYYKGLVRAFGEKCACCGRVEELRIDHKTPVSKGGFTSFDNLQLLCQRCNSLKGDMLYYEWLQYSRVMFK